jgi:hypothetical protein
MNEIQPKKKWYESILDWIKFSGPQSLIDLIMNYGGSYLAKAIGGFWGTVVSFVFKWVIMPVLKRLKNRSINAGEAKEKLEEHVAIINKPGVTHDEVTKSEDNFFNRP